MYNPDFMEYDDRPISGFSAQSPSTIAAQSDTAFVLKHNATAEIYQVFKEDVDTLFSGNVNIRDQAQLINHILLTLESLLTAFDDEKTYLMGDVLCNWAIRQQKLTIATLWTQQQNYDLLAAIDTQFEYFGELLEQTIRGLTYLAEQMQRNSAERDQQIAWEVLIRIVPLVLSDENNKAQVKANIENIKQSCLQIGQQPDVLFRRLKQASSSIIRQFPNRGFEDFLQRVRHTTHFFLFYSIIVSKQPPSVVVKCGEAENHRRSRFWFNTEIRILGGRAFGLHKNSENMPVNCYLITDDTAKRLLSNAYHEVFENEEFLIEPPQSILHSDEITGLTSKFDDMRVSKKGQLRRDSVATKRYCLCYNIRATAKFGIELIGKKVSLPFAILVGPKADVEAKLFLERSFADLVRKPLSEAPTSVNYQEMASYFLRSYKAVALEMKFQSILETPQKSTDTIPLIQPKAFTNNVKHHLIHRLKPEGTLIVLDNFMKLPVAEEYCLKKGSPEGDWKLVPYYEWFFKLAEMLNKHMLQMWNDNLIFGFCGKDEAEHLLNDCHHSTLLIRFSDIEFGKIKISVKDRTGVIRHHWYKQEDLLARALNRELLTNSKYAGIDYIYPHYPLEQCLGGREKPSSAERPRQLAPNSVYFENQEAAVSN